MEFANWNARLNALSSTAQTRGRIFSPDNGRQKGHCDRVCFAVKYHVNAVKKIPGIRAGFFRLIEARKLLYLAAAELNAPLPLFGEGVEMQRCRDARLERGNSIDRRYQSRETIASGGGGDESIVRP